MADFGLIPSTRVFARIQDELSSYEANGLLDTGKFFAEVKWFANQMGLAVYEFKEAIVKVEHGKGELPCDFYLLDSAWLCHHNWNTCFDGKEFPWREFQDKVVIYTEKECATISQLVDPCNQPNFNQVVVTACPNENILEKVTVKEYVMGNPFKEYNWEISFRHPALMQLTNKITRGVCSKDSPHLEGNHRGLFRHSEHDISIHKQGNTSYLYAHLKHPVIYIKYYAYPLDPDTNLPLIADDPILERALQDHLMLYFFKTLYLNGDEVNLENKIKMLKEDSERSMQEARYLSKLPSFSRMIETARRYRKKLSSYEQINVIHNY